MIFHRLLLSLLIIQFANSDALISTKKIIGADINLTISTPLSKATKFVSPNGSGNLCTEKEPCNLYTVVDVLVPGDIVFLKEGKYTLNKKLKINTSHSGTKDKPIIIESYPGKNVTIDGNQSIEKIKKEKKDITVFSKANYIYFRKLEIKNMSKNGLIIGGSYNLVEGCKIHHNFLSGILILDTINFNKTPFIHGFNTIKNNLIYNNSDTGLYFNNYKDGGNADGISISSGKFNKILFNTVFNNSDDGIDTWRSNDAEVAYNLVFKNGSVSGNGNGIKTGGNLDPNAKNGLRAYTHHNISYNNKSHGFNLNAGKEVIWQYNTAYNNGDQGYGNMSKNNLIIKNNIALENKSEENKKYSTDNSWGLEKNISILSKDPNSYDFLKPKPNTLFENMGAYANVK